MIEVFQPVGAAPETASAQLRFLDAVAEILADFDRNRQLNRLQHQDAESGRNEQFYRQIHATLDRRAISFHIANDGRRLLGCDRVSVLRIKGSHCQLLAASGVDIIDRRSNAARKLEAFGTATIALGEPLWYGEQSDGLAPQIEDRLHDYIDESQARQLGIIPLVIPHTSDDTDDRIVGALVIEHFSATHVDRLSERSSTIAPQCALALDNASQYERVPRWLRAVCDAGWLLGAKQLPKTLTALCALAMIVAALALVPADFEIEARGQLQPQIRDDVFAPIDGVVDPERLRVSHGQPVKKDEVLLALNSPQLDLDFRRVFGELNTALKRRDALEAKRLQNPRQTADEQQAYSQIIQEQEELAQTITGLQQQVQILQEQQNELTVKSAIAGQVITWDVQELLDTRPVQRGQVLLTVAQTSGDWVLELDLPDEDVGHVLSAQDDLAEDVVVTYQLATEPGVIRYGKIEQIGMTTEFDANDEPVVRVIVSLDDDEIAERRPGASVRAKLHCGRRSLGYVWFHDLFDYVNSWILF